MVASIFEIRTAVESRSLKCQVTPPRGRLVCAAFSSVLTMRRRAAGTRTGSRAYIPRGWRALVGLRNRAGRPRGHMRFFYLAVAGAMLLAGHSAQANVAITVDKNTQTMTVAVDGVQRYSWPVSTGIPSRETPNGNFRAFRMEEDHYSKEFDDAPMPHSIFFTKIGHAIHGTDSVNRLGTPASHGCVRLSRDNATTLYALVEQQGVLNTTVTLTGSSQIALARNPRTRPADVARRDPAEPYAPRYNAAGDPVVLT